jgi:hypothetical protein
MATQSADGRLDASPRPGNTRQPPPTTLVLAVSCHRPPGAAAVPLVEGARVEDVVDTARPDVGCVDPTAVDGDTIDDGEVPLDGGGVVLVVVVGRAVDGVVGARVVCVAVVGVVRGTVSRGGTDPGRTRMYNTNVTAKIALSATVERRT